MRESYSYFEGHFRSAQVNRSLEVLGGLEPRASVLAPTLFSLGGVPIAVPEVQPKVPDATQKERAALAPRGSNHPRRRREQCPVLQTASVSRRLRRWRLHLRRRRQQDPRSHDGVRRPAPGPQQPGHRPRGDQAARIRIDARRDERAFHRLHPSGPEGRPLDDEVGSLIIEPVLCGPGVIAPKANYLKRLRQLTRKKGIVLIFDEVLTGFRLAYGGAQEYYDIRPDMTTFGKIAGGGFQLAGFGGEAQIMNVLEPGRGWKYATFHAGTYNGHPISVAAGLKGLEILGEHQEYYDYINGLGRQLYSGLQDLADDRRIPAWVEYVGSIGNVYFTTKDEIRNFRDTLSANTRRWWNWFIHCLGNNVLFGIPNTGERAFICTEHTEEDVEWALEVADNAFAAIGKEARRHKEKAPTVQLQAVGEQAAVYGDAPTPPSV